MTEWGVWALECLAKALLGILTKEVAGRLWRRLKRRRARSGYFQIVVGVGLPAPERR